MTMYQTVTAEWNCTKCSVTNRKLVPRGTTEAKDRCVHCRAWHLVSPGERPIRWRARAA